MKISITIWVILITVIVFLLSINRSDKSDYQNSYDSLELVINKKEGQIFFQEEFIYNLQVELTEVIRERKVVQEEKPVAIRRVRELPKKEADALFLDNTDIDVGDRDLTPITIESFRITAANMLVEDLKITKKELSLADETIDKMGGIIIAHVQKDVFEKDERNALKEMNAIREEENKDLKKQIRKEKRKGTIKAIAGIAIGVVIAIL